MKRFFSPKRPFRSSPPLVVQTFRRSGLCAETDAHMANHAIPMWAAPMCHPRLAWADVPSPHGLRRFTPINPHRPPWSIWRFVSHFGFSYQGCSLEERIADRGAKYDASLAVLRSQTGAKIDASLANHAIARPAAPMSHLRAGWADLRKEP